MEQRRSPRFRTQFDALISSGRKEGAGTLAEISYSGARVEGASMQPSIGARITLYIFVLPVSPFELTGQVARYTETGFAVAYDLFDPEIRRLVDDVAALVHAPHAE